MTKLLIPGLTTVLDALNRHKKLRLNDNNLSLSLESAERVVKTERGHRAKPRLVNCLIEWAHALTS